VEIVEFAPSCMVDQDVQKCLYSQWCKFCLAAEEDILTDTVVTMIFITNKCGLMKVKVNI